MVLKGTEIITLMAYCFYCASYWNSIDFPSNGVHFDMHNGISKVLRLYGTDTGQQKLNAAGAPLWNWQSTSEYPHDIARETAFLSVMYDSFCTFFLFSHI